MIELSKLDIHQLEALSDYCVGNNICITGPGGTGKTHLINIINELSTISNKKCKITAMTGCAALLIKGVTLHSWAGIIVDDTNNQYDSLVKVSKALINNYKDLNKR